MGCLSLAIRRESRKRPNGNSPVLPNGEAVNKRDEGPFFKRGAAVRSSSTDFAEDPPFLKRTSDSRSQSAELAEAKEPLRSALTILGEKQKKRRPSLQFDNKFEQQAALSDMSASSNGSFLTVPPPGTRSKRRRSYSSRESFYTQPRSRKRGSV